MNLEIPVSIHIRNKIIDWISKKVTYTEIMKRVKEEGYSISRGGISYIKAIHEKEKTEQTEQTEQETEQTEQETEQTEQETKQEKAKTAQEIAQEKIKILPDPGDKTYLLDEFEQLKTYFRKGNRPSQIKAIENFEKHLKELIT